MDKDKPLPSNLAHLAIRLFKDETWIVVQAVLADLDSAAVSDLRNGENITMAPVTLQTIDAIRAKFRVIAADNGLEDPFARTT